MRLVFTKEENGDIKSQIHTGTVLSDFSYTLMINQLLVDSKIEEPEFNDLEEDEIKKIKNMLNNISTIFKSEFEDATEAEIGNED